MNINLTLVGQTLTFFLFIWFCKGFVWPALISVMKDREKKIEEGLQAAERAEKDLAFAKKNAAEKIHEAKEQAAAVIEAANKRSNQIIDEAKSQARAEADRLVNAAKIEVEQQTVRAREELRNEVTELALSVAEKVLASSIDVKDHQAMVNKLITDFYRD
ncbi:MAG: F0F1 ATP synthase subunit B [Gammaproteobacteria bacterium]|nr:F0F1 ATP synthase subunit B [Gammaproteobacteria bacterium]